MKKPEQKNWEILNCHYQADLVTWKDRQEPVTFQTVLSWEIKQRLIKKATSDEMCVEGTD